MAPREIPIGAFDLYEPIAEGGMGRIYSGEHRKSGAPVAVKVLTWARAREDEYIESFEYEARAVAGLDHPAIVRVLDYGRIDGIADLQSGGQLAAGSPYLVMPMARASLHEDNPVGSWPDLCALLLTLLDALGHAHARGIVHRDLKPANVLILDEPGRATAPLDGMHGIVLSDFGLAHPMLDAGEDDSPGAVIGTPFYMAPEQFSGSWREFGPPTDLYALGILAWRLACGARPFAGDSVMALAKAHCRDPLPPLQPRFMVPEGLSGWIEHLCEKDPLDRFPRAADAAHALRNLGPATLKAVLPLQLAEQLAPTILESDIKPSLSMSAPVVSGLGSGAGALGGPGASGVRAAIAPPLPDTWLRIGDQTESRLLEGAGLGLYHLRAVPMVGREPLRDRLWDRLRDVAATNRPAVVVLRGPAGRGKSRLAEWLQVRAHELGVGETLTAVHAPLQGADDGLGGMVARVTRSVGLPRERLLQHLERQVRARGVSDPHEWQGLAELADPVERINRDTFRFRSPVERYVLVERLLRRRTRGGRVAVVHLDDVQWGIDTLAFVHHVMGLSRSGISAVRHGLPALFVLTVRDDALAERPAAAELLQSLLEHPKAEDVVVEPLTDKERRALVEQLLGLEGELATRVEQRSGGNPLFAVQLVGDWVRRGLLTPARGGFELAEGAEVSLPDDLFEVWSRRVERVLLGRETSERVALELAAALGRAVDAREWADACERARVPVPMGLVESLLRDRLAVAGEPGRAFAFAHNMLRETLLLAAERAGRLTAVHGICADILHCEHGTDCSERVGRHLVSARRWDEAVAPLARGAENRLDNGENRDAAVLLSEWDAALAEADIPTHDDRRAHGALMHVRRLRMVGDFDAAQTRADALVEAARTHGWRRAEAQCLQELGRVARVRGQSELAMRHLQAAREVGKGDARIVADCTRLAGLVLMHRGRFDKAIECARQALSLYTDPVWAAASRMNLGIATRLKGEYEAATALVREALDEFVRVGCVWGQAECLNELGEAARHKRDLAAAAEFYRQSLERNLALGSGDAVFAETNLGLVLSRQERWDEAREALQGALTTFSEQGRQGFVGITHGLLLPVSAADRRWDEWDAHIHDATLILETSGMVDVDAAAEVTRAGGLASIANEPVRALDAYRLAVRQWKALGREDKAKRVAAAMKAIRANG